MILLRVSTALTVSMMLAACSPAVSRRQTTPPPMPMPARTPATAPTASVDPASPPVVPQAAPAVTPASAPVPANPLPLNGAEAQKPKPSPIARANAETRPRAQATPATAAAPKPASTPTSSLRGHVVLDAGSGQSIAPGEVSDAVIYFVPDRGARHAKPGNFLMYTHNKRFDPPLLVIPVGSTVKFPNQDEILHNVYSTTPGSTFDLGIYGNGGASEYTFRKPGLVLIHCNVHESMQADVLVLDTPYIARPTIDGTFDLDGLQSGPGKLMLWHPRAARPVPLAISLPTSESPVVRIAITRPRAPPHHDKDGKPYRSAQP